MSKPRKKNVFTPPDGRQTKTLISEWPGKTAILVDGRKVSPMRFAGAHAALDWAEAHHAAFYYLPADSGARN